MQCILIGNASFLHYYTAKDVSRRILLCVFGILQI